MHRMSKWLLVCMGWLWLTAGIAHALTDAEFGELVSRPAAAGSAAGATLAPNAAQSSPLATRDAALRAPSAAGLFGRLALALGAVFGLMFAILWAAKKYLPKSTLALGGGSIEIVATRPLGQRRSLMLVRTQGRTLLLGATPSAINLISELDETEGWDRAAARAGLAEAALQ